MVEDGFDVASGLGDRISGGETQLLLSFLMMDLARNLIVARDGLRFLGFRVGVPVMICTMPNQDAAKFLNLPDEVSPLHSATTSSSTFRM